MGAPAGVDTSTVPLSRVVDPADYVPSGAGDRAGLGGSRPGVATATMDTVARDSGDTGYAISGGRRQCPGQCSGASGGACGADGRAVLEAGSFDAG